MNNLNFAVFLLLNSEANLGIILPSTVRGTVYFPIISLLIKYKDVLSQNFQKTKSKY